MQSYSWFLWSVITFYNKYYSYRIIQKCLWFISINMICIKESFMTHSNIAPFVEQVYCWIFIPIYCSSSNIGTYMFFNYLFSPFLVKQLLPLCLGWRIFIFVFNITFCKMLIMAPLCIIRFTGHIRCLFI